MPLFINADLEITAAEDLSPLRDAWGEAVVEMCCQWRDEESFFASFEINSGNEHDDPELLISRFCDLITTLPSDLRQTWDSASRRVIDIGYQSDQGDQVINTSISPELLRSVSSLGLAIVITVYPLEGKLI